MIKFSYHKDCIGKPIRDEDTGILWVGDTKINLGFGWKTAELPFEDIFELLTVHGLAFAPALNSDHRIQNNFVSHELALVDIDNGMTLEELKEFPFYQKYGSGYYTTSSHTDQEPRFRILYRLPIVVTDTETMRVIYEGLLAIHGRADISCKDPVRLFYGSVNASHKEITNRMITADGIKELVDARDVVKAQQQQYRTAVADDNRQFEPKSVEQVAELLDELKKYYPDLSHDPRRDVTWAVSTSVSNVETINLMRSRWDDSNKTRKYESFVNARRKDALTLGTIYHMIRQYNPMFGKKKKQSLENIDILRLEDYQLQKIIKDMML